MKKGFTLVEAMLTLSIIGVIAAITISTMIHETNKKSTIEQLKKTAATLNQAVYNATITSGQVEGWSWATDEGIASIMQNIITPRLNVGYMCSGNGAKSTYCSYMVTDISGSQKDISTMFQAKTRVLLNDGSLVAFTDAKSFTSADRLEGNNDDGIDHPTETECTWGGSSKSLCGIFMVDVNGNKKPNIVGKDVFYYGIYLSGAVLPYGANEGDEFIEKNCSKDSNGTTCAAKITRNGWDVCYNNCGAGVSPYPVKF